MEGLGDNSSRVFLRYAAFQLPGLALVVAALLAVRHFINLPLWVSVTVIVGWVAKDLVMFPFLKAGYSGCKNDTDLEMAGMKGEVLDALSPVGNVRVRGEIWKACASSGGLDIEVGQTVRVKGRKGLTLIIEPYCDNGKHTMHMKGCVASGRRSSGNE